MTLRKRTSPRARPNDQEPSQLTGLLVWTIGILLLISTAVLSWIGSFHIFGHPEEPFSYKVLLALKKVEAPKRFEPLSAPRGDFLSPDALYKRYANLNPRQLDEVNSTLIRNYLRNYIQVKEPVPYAIGQYTILDTFPLGPDDYFPSGVVALARASQDPRIILEQIFPSHLSNVTNLERMLQTGLEFNLQKKLDFSAIIYVQKLRDGRIKLLTVSLLYGEYASTQGSGTFSLEPPPSLNVAAGLPIVLASRLDAATEKYAAYCRKVGLSSDPLSSSSKNPSKIAQAPTQPQPASNQLLRIQRPEPVDNDSPTPSPSPTPSFASASPSPAPKALPAVPTAAALPALPVEEPSPSPSPQPLIASSSPSPSPSPSPKPSPKTSPSPSPSPSPTTDSITNAQDRNWKVHEPGQMPRGRLRNATASEMSELANSGIQGEKIYLQGNFIVTASSSERAVLRPQSRLPFGDDGSKVRIIADFPTGSSAPQKNERFSRDSSRPFQIMSISRSQDGTIDVKVREITKP